MQQSVDITSYGRDFCEVHLHDGVSPGCERISGNPRAIARMVLNRMEILGIPHGAMVFVEWNSSSKTIEHYLWLSEQDTSAEVDFKSPENKKRPLEVFWVNVSRWSWGVHLLLDWEDAPLMFRRPQGTESPRHAIQNQ